MHRLAVEYPLYCKVAPSRESVKLPTNPLKRATLRHCSRGIVAPLTVVSRPELQNVRPISKLPTTPHKVPSTLTPPLVPLGTDCKSHLTSDVQPGKQTSNLKQSLSTAYMMRHALKVSNIVFSDMKHAVF